MAISQHIFRHTFPALLCGVVGANAAGIAGVFDAGWSTAYYPQDSITHMHQRLHALGMVCRRGGNAPVLPFATGLFAEYAVQEQRAFPKEHRGCKNRRHQNLARALLQWQKLVHPADGRAARYAYIEEPEGT